MGCDIHGFVEVDKYGDGGPDCWWRTSTYIPAHVGRCYDAFGCLFGVRNYANYDPIAADRGVPNDAATLVREKYESWGVDAHSASHLTHKEVMDADWSKTAEEPDSRYRVLDENMSATGTKFADVGEASAWWDIIQDEANQEKLRKGKAVPNEDETAYIQRHTPTRREALSDAWRWLMFEHMATLAGRYGDNSVRMVVWFDN